MLNLFFIKVLKPKGRSCFMSRDNLDLRTKETLVKRVWFKCSNPNFKKLTNDHGLEATE